MLDIVKTLSKRIKSVYSTSPIYIEDIPDNFKRPSFYITLIDSKPEKLFNNTIQNNMKFKIIYFSEFNNQTTNINANNVYNALPKIQYLFNIKSLPIELNLNNDHLYITQTHIYKNDNNIETIIDCYYNYIHKELNEEEFEIMEKLNHNIINRG